MALTKCGECGKDVSNQADKCPHCGAAVKKKGGCGRTAVFILGVVLLAAVVLPAVCMLVKTPTRRPQYSAAKLYADAQSQFSRGRFHQARQTLESLVQHLPASPYAESARNLALKVSAAEEERLSRATAGLRKKVDEVKGVSWFQDKSSPEYANDRNCIFTYFGRKAGGAPELHLIITYVADDWLFIERYLLRGDDSTFVLSPGGLAIERDNGRRGVYEWYDVVAGAQEIALARAVANSRKTVLRYDGQHSHLDRTVSESEKQALKNVLAAYDALSDKP